MLLKFTTANVDFALKGQKVQKDLARITPISDAICFQEAKRVNVKRLISNPAWHTNQDLSSAAVKGSGVAWKTPPFTKLRSGNTVGVRPGRYRMLTRHISWVNVKFVENGKVKKIRIVSLHMPPKRYSALYPAMLNALAALIRATRIPMMIGADWNKLVVRDKTLKAFARRSGGKFYGAGIDGFLFIPKGRKFWRITKVRKVKGTFSDHDFVNVVLDTRGK